MCTLIVATRWFSDWPLVVAANRDEALDRPAAPPTVRKVAGTEALAPTDLVAGGTWLGLNRHGLFVAITNRFGVPVDPARPSRGGLVTRALAASSAAAAFEDLRTIDGAAHNGFHLVMADLEAAFLVRGDGEALVAEPLLPGQHVITERSFGAAPTAREPLVERHIDAPRGGPAPALVFWQDVLRRRAEPSFDGVLVDLPDDGYGTRSSTIVQMNAGDVRFHHANGRPDLAPYEDYSSEARTLLGR